MPVFLTEHIPSPDFISLFHALARKNSEHELIKVTLDCLIQLCILKLACRKRNILFDHCDFMSKNVLVKRLATQTVLLSPSVDADDRSYNTPYVFLITDFDEACVQKLDNDANISANAVNKHIIPHGAVVVCTEPVGDENDLRKFLDWVFHTSSALRASADNRKRAKFRPLRRLVLDLMRQLYERKNTTAYASLVEKWVNGDLRDDDKSLFMHFFYYVRDISEQVRKYNTHR